MIKEITILAIGILLNIMNLSAQGWIQIGQDIDGESTGDRSGHSISINSDGSIVAIGAYRNDGNGVSSGHVRIYENMDGTWTQIGQDIDGESSEDYSGISVSLNSEGTIVAIGAYKNDGNGSDAGHVRIFENMSGTWVQIGQDIDGEQYGDYCGLSVDLNSDGSIVAVGSPYHDANGSEAGHVRIFENISGNWEQIGQTIDGGSYEDHFGGAVSLDSDGSIVAIGAADDDPNNLYAAGSVSIFENQDGNWVQIGQNIEGEAQFDYSGSRVNINSDGTVVAVGAYGNDGNGSDAGHVRIFENQANNWIQIGEDIDGEAPGDMSGISVCLNLDGTIVAIGAYFNDGNGDYAGHARFFENQEGNWEQIGDDIDGEFAEDRTGISVGLSADGSIVAIGADYNDGNGDKAGHVRVFKSQPTEISELLTKEILFYPNPTNGIINLKFSNNNIQKITITDITGKQIFEKFNVQQKNEINLTDFKTGIYIIKIQMENEIFTTKIIKE